MCRLYTDGGARGNPGPAAIAGILMYRGKIMDTFSDYIGIATNNQAEYRALMRGLEIACDRGIRDIQCFLDSQLIVRQLNGIYKIKNRKLKELVHIIENIRESFTCITFHAIPRQQNKYADSLVNKVLDRQQSFPA